MELDQQHCHSPSSSSSASLKHKLKQTLCLSCCFPSNPRPSSDDRPVLLRPPTFWMKSTDLPEIKDKCRNLIGRIGGRHRRHSTSADFHYDPLSYALNFDDGGFDSGDYDDPPNPIRSFSSRLQASSSRTSQPLRAIPEVDGRVLPPVIAAIS